MLAVVDSFLLLFFFAIFLATQSLALVEEALALIFVAKGLPALAIVIAVNQRTLCC